MLICGIYFVNEKYSDVIIPFFCGHPIMEVRMKICIPKIMCVNNVVD